MFKLVDNFGNVGVWGDFETMILAAKAYAAKGIKVKVIRLSSAEEADLRAVEAAEQAGLIEAENAWLRRAEYDPEALAEMKREDAMGYSFEDALAWSRGR